jgi:hypothetical protein
VKTYEAAGSAGEMAELADPSATRHLEEMQHIFPLLATALFSDLEVGRRLFRDYLEPLIRQRGNVLHTLLKEGIDPEFAGVAVFGMHFAIVMQRWFNGEQGDLSDAATQCSRLLAGGFAPVKGRPKAGTKDIGTTP